MLHGFCLSCIQDIGFMHMFNLVHFFLLETNYIKLFVLDEADEMLSRGFKDQIYNVFRCMPENIQVSSIFFYYVLLKYFSYKVKFQRLIVQILSFL